MIKLDKLSTKPEKGIDKRFAEEETIRLKEKLYKLQNLLYAEKKHSLLIILQGMDASGKDGTIRHVFSCVNPQGCTVKSFKTPTEEETLHDFLWRVHMHAPARGMIQIFNRSHYEDILYPTVHKTLDKDILKKRYRIINNFEKGLADCGITIMKFFLHLSREEQKKRLKERKSTIHKKWKYSSDDIKEGKLWDDYMNVYEEIMEQCSPEIPWDIVPADHRWYRNFYVANKIVDVLKDLKMKYPS